MVRPVDNLIIGADLLGFQQPMFAPGLLGSQPETVPVTAAPAPVVAQPAPISMALPTPPPPRPRQAATTTPAAQPYDDAIMRNARGFGLLAQTPTSAPVQAQTGLLSDFFGTSFEDPRTRRNLAGAAALLQAGGPQTRPVGTGQAVGMGIEAMLKQQNEMDKLKKVSAKGFEARGPVVRKGSNDYLGEAVFNPTTGQLMLSTPSGEMVPMPADAEPTVKSALSGERLSGNQMVKLAGEVRNSENTLRKLNKYLETQGGTNQGFQRMGDELIANLKTFFGTNDLTPEQLNQLIVKGQAQAILGGMRVATVGPGVMTEQDAARVLAAIGGNPDALQNPAVMGKLIRDAFEYQYNVYDQQYEDLALAYDFYGRPMRDKLLNPFDVSGTVSSSDGDVGFTIIGEE
tara:strand:+ start:2288 stop:3490 length:1203 start_codon:yes stop_codon:yes gene_type:complete